MFFAGYAIYYNFAQTCSQSEIDELLVVCPSGLTRNSPLSDAIAAGELFTLLLGDLVCNEITGDSGQASLVYKTGSSSLSLSLKQKSFFIIRNYEE